MNSGNSKTSDPHRPLRNLSDKINLKTSNRCCFIKPWHLLHMEKYKKVIKNNKFKVSSRTWKEEFELSDGSYSAWDIKDYFEYQFYLEDMSKNL